MSSPFKDGSAEGSGVWPRLAAVALFAALMAASAVTNHGITPVTGAAPTPASVSKPLDAAAALLAEATGPYDEVTFCEPPKAYVPDLVQLGMGSAQVDTAPYRPVILCPTHALDFPLAVGRAKRDGLAWARGVENADLIAFAADEPSFRAAMAQAGSALRTATLRPFSPQLASLRSNAPGAEQDLDGWRLPAHPGDELLLFGPYMDLAAGAYRIHFDLRLRGAPDRCRQAQSRIHPSVAVTSDTGRTTLAPQVPAALSAAPEDPCRLSIEASFAAPAGGAKTVETPLHGAAVLPMIVDGYSLEPAAAAQSR